MYRVGLIGNRAHQMTYGPIIEARDDCRIVAAAEHNAEKAKPLESHFGVSCSADYDAVLEDPNVDVVSIATDFYLKRRLITKAVACGKHVLVDKSLARTVREARETIEGTQGGKAKIALSYAHRYQPTFAKLTEAVRAGACQRVTAFTHHFVRQFPDSDLMAYVSYPTPPRVNGGGELMNLGSHPVDIMYRLFGLPRRVYCHVETAYWGEYYRDLGTEDMATLLCEYDGFAATIVTGRGKVREEQPAVNTIEMICEGEWIRIDAQENTYLANGRAVGVPDLPLPPAESCVQHLFDCIESDSEPESGLENGLAVAEITTAGYQSAASGQFVQLPLQDENHPMIDVDEQVIDGYLD